MSDIKQLTNGIVWYDESITITLAFGSGNGNFYHISVLIEFTISWDPNH